MPCPGGRRPEYTALPDPKVGKFQNSLIGQGRGLASLFNGGMVHHPTISRQHWAVPPRSLRDGLRPAFQASHPHPPRCERRPAAVWVASDREKAPRHTPEPAEEFYGLRSHEAAPVRTGALSLPEFRVCQTIGIAQGAANRSALTQPQTETTPKPCRA